ncbi:Phospholipase A2 [Rhynchospora pubera]|uniref:phospholipase A2 n=1 Tax=Rhynchospora pubera TaxID=906938 RepID=A0AAV8D689_9POAL|nr:Phospholipase A2 [Rhynchospora pubera]
MGQKRSKPQLGECTSFLLFSLLGFFLLFSSPTQALNVGIQSVSPGGEGVSKQECSRTCESDHCSVAPFLRYGKYCGILYSGCPSERPCDALDACCMVHDNCVQAKNNDYLSTECNQNLLNCLANLNENSPTFKGNKCLMRDVIEVISVVIEAAVLAGRVLHKP